LRQGDNPPKFKFKIFGTNDNINDFIKNIVIFVNSTLSGKSRD
jgi:hypothetical protein